MDSTLPEKSTKCIGEILVSNLSKIEDFRNQKQVFYPLNEILFLIVVARICDCRDDVTTVVFGKSKLAWFRKYLPYKKGIPSHDVLNYTMRIVSPLALSKILLETFESINETLEGKTIHIDGKRLRGSATKKEAQTKKSEGGEQSKIMVNVFCSEVKMCLTSHEVLEKGGEKGVLDNILEVLDIKGSLVTMDSAYCYRDVANKIVDKEASYMLAVKGNQGNLLDAIENIIEFPTDIDLGKIEISHGRVEERVCKVVNVNNIALWLDIKYGTILKEWPNIQTIIQIESKRNESKDKPAATEFRYYITNKNLTAIEANKIVRGHWEIENGLHWTLDVVIGEDGSRKRKDASPINNSIINKTAFNILYAKNDEIKISKRAKMKNCGWNEDFLDQILGFK